MEKKYRIHGNIEGGRFVTLSDGRDLEIVAIKENGTITLCDINEMELVEFISEGNGIYREA